jgi:hypothetical protein
MEKNDRQLLLSLLKAELKNTKLVRGLESIGMNPDDFYLGISSEILKLAGFQKEEIDEELYDFYFEELDHHCQLEYMEFRQKLDSLAEELLKELEKRKNNG